MEIKEGNYVRTIYGIKRIDQFICGQDVRFDNTDGFDEDLEKYHNYDGISINSNEWKEIVMGEPKEKPIDLIEVGDYINGKKVEWIGYKLYRENEDKTLIGIGEKLILFNEFTKDSVGEKGIKSIVTKEQFESIEYRV